MKLYQCNNCGKLFGSKRLMLQHIIKNHETSYRKAQEHNTIDELYRMLK